MAQDLEERIKELEKRVKEIEKQLRTKPRRPRKVRKPKEHKAVEFGDA